MNSTNEFRDAVCYKKKDGSFAIFDSLDAISESQRQTLTGEYQLVKVSWNNGQPLVSYGYSKISIVDIDKR